MLTTWKSWDADKRAIMAARALNLIALVALLGVLTGSLRLQFVVGEQPCPLCLVQRAGMIGLALGPVLNLLWGIKPINYALSILAAFVGGAGSVRQDLLHIADPADPGYGPQVMSFHLYTWALITFAIAVVGCAFLLMWTRTFTAKDRGLMAERGPLRAVTLAVITWFSIYVVVITVSVIPECGIGMCPDDPANTSGMASGLALVALVMILVVSGLVGFVLNRRLPEVSR